MEALIIFLIILGIISIILRMISKLGVVGRLTANLLTIPFLVFAFIIGGGTLLYFFSYLSTKLSPVGIAYEWWKSNTGISWELFQKEKKEKASEGEPPAEAPSAENEPTPSEEVGGNPDGGNALSSEKDLTKDIQSFVDSFFEKEDEALLNRNSAVHSNIMPPKDAFGHLKDGKYSSSEEWEKEFFGTFPKTLEANHMVWLSVEYSHESFSLKDNVEKKTLKITLDKDFLSCKLKQEEDLYVFGSLEGRVKNISGFGTLAEMLNEHQDSKLEKMFNSTLTAEAIAVSNDCNMLHDVVLRTKGLEFLKQLSKSSYLDSYSKVTINKVILKKDDIVQNIDMDDVRRVFGFKSPEYTSKIPKISSKKYEVMTSSLFFQEEALSFTSVKEEKEEVFSKIAEGRYKATNGFTYFQLFDNIKKKRAE